MNISSAIVHIKKDEQASVIDVIRKIKNCEIHLVENQKLIITIEDFSADKEIESITKIEKLPGVISVTMVYSYSEDELNAERDKLEKSEDNTPIWLNDENAKAEDIRYNGDLKNKY